jgi:hypothetical protein
MNLYHDDGISFFGDLTVYTQGYMQALLHNEPNSPMLRSNSNPLPPDGNTSIQ